MTRPALIRAVKASSRRAYRQVFVTTATTPLRSARMDSPAANRFHHGRGSSPGGHRCLRARISGPDLPAAFAEVPGAALGGEPGPPDLGASRTGARSGRSPGAGRHAQPAHPGAGRNPPGPRRAAGEFQQQRELRGRSAGAPAQSHGPGRGAKQHGSGFPRGPAGAQAPRDHRGGSTPAHRQRHRPGPRAHRPGGQLRGGWRDLCGVPGPCGGGRGG